MHTRLLPSITTISPAPGTGRGPAGSYRPHVAIVVHEATYILACMGMACCKRQHSTRIQARASATLVVPAQRLAERPLLLASPWSLQAIIYSFKKNSDKDCMPLLMPTCISAAGSLHAAGAGGGGGQLGTRTILCPMLLLDLGPRCHESLPTVLHASRQAT